MAFKNYVILQRLSLLTYTYYYHFLIQKILASKYCPFFVEVKGAVNLHLRAIIIGLFFKKMDEWVLLALMSFSWCTKASKLYIPIEHEVSNRTKVQDSVLLIPKAIDTHIPKSFTLQVRACNMNRVIGFGL